MCGVVDGGLLGGAAAISWAIPISSIKWRSSASATADLQRISKLESQDLFAYQDASEADEGALVVAPGTPGRFQSVIEAVSEVKPGGTIRIAAGTYSGDLIIDKTIALIGDGRPEDVVINSFVTIMEGSVVTLENMSFLKGLTIRGHASVEQCRLFGTLPLNVGSCAQSGEGQAVVRHSTLAVEEDFQSSDAFVPCGNLMIEQSTLSGATYAAIELAKGSNVTVDKCIFSGNAAAVHTSGGSYVMIKNSDLSGLSGGAFVPRGANKITVQQ